MRARGMCLEKRFSTRDPARHATGTAARINMTAGIAGIENGKRFRRRRRNGRGFARFLAAAQERQDNGKENERANPRPTLWLVESLRSLSRMPGELEPPPARSSRPVLRSTTAEGGRESALTFFNMSGLTSAATRLIGRPRITPVRHDGLALKWCRHSNGRVNGFDQCVRQ